MKARILLLLTSFTCIILGRPIDARSQVQALGTVIGNQTVVSIPIAPPGYPTAQALVYYPDDYFLPANASKRYPLFVFMHGAGEGSGTNITEVENTSLPMLIKQGLKPYGIDQATGDTVKYIIVSPHCASCGSNYSYPQLQYTIPSLFTAYRVDTSCVWVGGLSAGARGTWSVVMGGAVGDTVLGKRITGIMPMANGGYDNMLASMEPNLDTIARRGLHTLYVIGDQDPGYNSIGFFAYQAVMKTYSQPGHYFDKVIVGGTHSGNVWNTPFPENAGVWSSTMNSWTQMWSMRKTASAPLPPAIPANTAPTADAGANQAITLPTSTVSLSGTGTDAEGAVTYKWTQVSGPNTTDVITTSTAAATTVTGLAAGVYVFKLTVTDAGNLTATSTVQVTVNAAAAPANTAPTADAGANQAITLPISTVSLSGTGTDAEGAVTYQWSQVSGPNTTDVITTNTAAATTVTGLVAGVYVFKLTVTDAGNLTATSTVQVTVNAAAAPANTAPTADAGANQAITLPISTVSLSGTGTDAEGAVTYQWSQVSGPNTTDVITTSTAAATTVTGLVAGVYVFKLTVTDAGSLTATSTVQVTVNAAAAPPSGPSTGTVVRKVACTEYQAAWLYSDSTVRSFIYNPLSGHVEFTPFIIGGRKAVDASTGFNRITILDDQGYVWLNDGGKNTATRWNTDATGAAFNGNLSIYGYFYTYLSIRNDGTIWYWGGDDYKFYGGTPVTAPVKITQPAGVQFVKLATGNALLGLTSTGDVYQWNKGSMAFTKVTLPRPASDIGASHMNYFVAVVPDDITVSKMGYPYAWGSESKFWGGDGSSYTPSAPVPLKALWNMPAPIKKISMNQNTIHYIDANGDLYGIGDNPNGEIGNGVELVNHAEKYPTPYAWSWTKYEMLTGAPAIHVAPGIKFKDLFSGNSFVFYKYALDVNDSLYFWGRNKSFVGGDGVVNNQEATSPNALDILTPTLRTPLAIKPTQTAGFNFTAYTLKATPKQTIITTTAVLSATSTSSKLVTAGFPNYGYTIVKYQWTKVSGPACTISTPNALTTNVTGLTTGTYIFTIQTTDNNTGTISANDTIVVNAAAPGVPVADAGPDQVIQLPTNSVTLTGTGAENGGTIVSYKWSQVSGPNTAGISTNTLASTGVTGMVQGVYVFQLLITDQAGTTATSTVQVTVKPAIVPGPPSANAGVDQTITLPTNSVTLAGSGSETNGTIVSYKWVQTSGPNTATITTNTQAGPTVTGLIAGVYTFQLTVTDNSGITATDVVTINVKAAVVVGPPVANAGIDQTITLPTSSVTLTGSGSESNGAIASYKWTQVSGPNTGAIISSTQATTGVSGLIQGVFVFQLMVTDNAGVTATDVMTVNVKPAVVTPGTPIVDAGANQAITLPTSSVTLTGVASETNGSIVLYEWTQVSGPSTANIVSSGTAQTDVNGLVAGAYILQLKVTDNSGVSATDVVKITVNAAVVPGTPVVDAGVNQVITVPASTVTLTGVASETNGSIVLYEWTEISGPNTAIIASSGTAQTGVSGLVQGVYTFQLKVTDNSGVSATDVVKVTVNPAAANKPPVADAGPNKVVGDLTPVDLDGSASYDPDGTIVKYDWIQLSGLGGVTITGASTATPTIYGLESGTYVFQLTVTDNQGATDIATVTITVTAAGGSTGPVAVVGNDTTIIFPGQTTALLNGSASYDSSGTITKYSWKQLSGPSAALIGDPMSSVSGVGAMIIGDYTFELTITDDKGAQATATMRVHVLDDLRHKEHVKIYPNPVPMGQAFTAEGTTDSASVVKFTIYDIGGRMVKQVILNSQFSDFRTTIPVAGLGRGVYVLLVQFGATGKPQTFKFVID